MSQIGSIVVIKEDYYFNDVFYPKGHQFKVIGSSYLGLDIEDARGNKIYETLLISHLFSDIVEVRDRKIDQILKNEK